MAGRIAVGIADGLVERSLVVLDADGGKVTEAGWVFLESRGIRVPAAPKRRVFCRPCLDWSERRPHLAGIVGAALLTHALDCGWVQRVQDSRALAVTPAGRTGLAETFGIGIADHPG